MAKISIQDLVHVISDKHGITQKEAGAFVTALFDVIGAGLKADRLVKIKGLGTFKVIDVRDRESVDVNTGERIVIDGRSKITFTPDSIMRDIVNRPFAQFETVVINDGVNIEELVEVDKKYESDNVPDLLDVSIDEADEAVQDSIVAGGESGQATVAVTGEGTGAVTVAAEAGPEAAAKVEDDICQDSTCAESMVHASVQEPYKAEDVADKDRVADINGGDDIAQCGQEACNNAEDGEVVYQEEPDTHEDVSGYNARRRPLMRLLFYAVPACLLIAAGAAYIGYYFGKNGQDAVKVAVTAVKKPEVEKKLVAVPVKKDSIDADTLKASHKKDTLSAAGPVKKDAVSKNADNKGETEKERKKPESISFSEKYDKANVMVRTGAYRIVGIERTIVLRKGQTLSSVSKAILGPGMECYIEALNGIKDAEEGQSLKIPKLELRKKKR